MREGDYFRWPLLSDLFPYQRSGSKFGRLWPIGETQELLQIRWRKLLSESGTKRAKLFKNNQYRKIERQYIDHLSGELLPSVASLEEVASCPKISPYAFRAYDRRWAFEDIRLSDRMGEALWRLQGDGQLYLTSLTTKTLGAGQAIVASASVPDLDHFCGRGGKDVIPLYRDASAAEPNVTGQLLVTLSEEYGFEVSAENFAAYVCAILGGQSYSKRFWNELETPGARVPLTKDGAIFASVAKLGRKLIWLQTYAQRFRGAGRGPEVPQGKATTIKGVSSEPDHYPAEYSYDFATREIIVGGGRFGPVSPAVWDFEVSGLKVVRSWLGYRMSKRKGKRSSPLDDLRPKRWTARMSDELLELLWVLEATIALEPKLKKALDSALSSPCFTAVELPQPAPWECKAPNKDNAADDLLE